MRRFIDRRFPLLMVLAMVLTAVFVPRSWAHVEMVCDSRRNVMANVRTAFGEVEKYHDMEFSGGVAEFWWVRDRGKKFTKILIVTTTTALGMKSCLVADGLLPSMLVPPTPGSAL